MGLKIEYIKGQTPLDDEESEGLLIKTISTKEELDEFEQLNIQNAIQWSISRKIPAKDILTEGFIRALHVKMFDKTWKWAGQFRKSEKSIGIEPYQIGIQLRQLLEDTEYWIKDKTYKPDEIAIRFKHRIVQIHCFSNGNGRHSRLMADIIASHIFNNEIFSWGGANLSKDNDMRKAYIESLRSADKHNIDPLLIFSRT